MDEREPNLVTSGLSRTMTAGEISVEVCIYRLENDPDWILEVVNSEGTSIVWDDPLPSDDAANEEFLRTVAEEGIKNFRGTAKIIPFRQ